MGVGGIWQWAIIGVVVVLLFGRGKISELMGDVAKGIKSFKKGMSEDDDVAQTEEKKEAPRSIEHQKSATVATEESTAPQKKAG